MADRKSARGTKGPRRPRESPQPPPPLPPPSPDFLAKCLDVAQVMLVALDREGRITLVNRKAASVLGWEAEDLLGRDWFETCVPPSDRSRVKEGFAAILRGDPVPLERFENPVLTRTGENRLIEWRNTVLADGAGAVAGTLSSGQDITAQKASERTLLFLGSVAEQVGDGMAVADPEGSLLWVNRAWASMHGYEPGELIGRHLSVGHTARQLETDVIPFNEKVFSTGHYSGRVGHVRKDGTTFQTLMTTTLLKDEAGQVRGILGTARDISEQERTALKLQEARARLDTLIANSPVIIYTCVPEGDFPATFVSETVTALLGYAPEEFIRDPGFWVSHVHPEDRARVLDDLPGLFQRGWHTHRYRFLHRDGTYRWMRDDLRLLRDSEGRPQQIVGSWLDITEQQALQLELQASEERYRTLVENIQDGVFIIRGEVFTFVNRAFAAIVGSTAEEVTGRRFTDFIAPEDLPLVHDRYRRRQAGEAVPNEYDFRVLHGDGHTRRTVRMNVGLVSTPAGIASIGTLKDVTEQSRMEAELRLSEEKYRGLFENIQDGVFITREGRFVFVNEALAAMLGYSPEELVGRSFTETLVPEDVPSALEHYRRSQAGETVPHELDLRALHRDGRTRITQRVNVSIMHTPEGLARIGTVKDVTEKARIEEALRASEIRHRALLEAIPDLIFVLDERGVFLDYHAQADSMLYRPAEEFLGHTLEEALPADLADKVRRSLAEASSGGRITILEYDLTFHLGTRFFEARILPQADEKFLVLVRDTTERQRAEMEANRALAQFQTVVENTPMVAIQGLDREGRVTLWYPASEAMYGYSSGEALGRRLGEFLLSGEEAESFERSLADIWRTGLPTPPTEWPVTHRDGSRRWIYSTAFPVLDGTAVSAVFCMDVDISPRKLAEEGLRESEGRLKRIFENAPIGMATLGADLRFSATNPAFSAMMGYEESELTAITFKEITHPDHLAADMAQVQRLVKGEIPVYKTEKRYIRKDGSVLWGALTVTTLRTAEGELAGLLAMVEDITDRKRAEEALRASEAKYRQIFDGVSEGIYVSTADGHPVLANPALVRMLGFESEADLNRRDISREGYHDPSERARFQELIERDGRVTDFEAHWNRKDGSVITVLLNSRGVRGPDGEIHFYEGLVRDITDRKRAEEERRKSEERFRLLAETTTTAIMIFQEGRFVYANPSATRISGFSQEEILTMDLFDHVHPEDLETFRGILESRQRGEQPPQRYQFRILSKEGRAVWLDVSVAPTVFGERPAILASCTDLTDYKLAGEALRESEERFRNIVEHSTNLFYSHTPEHVLTYVSPQSWRFFDCAPEEALVRWTEFVTQNPVNEAGFRSTQKAIDEGLAQPPYELELETRKGRIVWVQVNEAPVVKDGRTVAIVGALTDITERKTAEDALRQSEFWLKESQRVSRVGSYVLEVDSGLWTASEALDDIFGMEPGEEHSVAGWVDVIHPDHRGELSSYLRDEVLGRGIPFDHDYKIVRRDNGEVRWVLGKGQLVADASGRSTRMVGTIQDITERKVVEEALRESEAKYRLILETVREIIYFVSHDTDTPDGRVTFVSPQMEEILGHPPEELLGETASFQRILHPKDRDAVLESFRTLLAGRGPESREYRLQNRRTGDYHWVEDLGVPVRDAAGRVVGFQGVVRDITDRKRADELIRRKNLQLMALVDSSEALGKMDFPQSAAIICEAARVAFKAQLVWIGLVDPETTEVIPAAAAGDTDGYVRSVRVRWDESPRSKGPTGLCIKRRMPVTMSVHEEAFAPWRGEALRRGFLYTCAVPLLHEDTVRGAINFYTSDPAGFPPDSLEIMELFARHTVLALVSSNLYHEAHSSLEELIQKEEALQEKTAHFVELFQSSPEAVAILDSGDRIVEVNRAFAALFGWAREELVGRPINEVVVPPGLVDEAASISVRTLAGAVVEAEGVRQRRDGSLLTVSILGAPIRIGGQRTGVLAIYRDITAWKRAEEALLASEHKYKVLVETTETGYVILGPDGLVLDANPEYIRLTGRKSLEEVVGRSVVEWTAPEDRERNAEQVRLCLETGSVRNLEVGYTAPDGRVTPVEVNATVVHEADGLRIVTLVRDISDRKRSEEAMRIRDHALGTSVSAVAMSDLEGRVTYVNAAVLNLWGFRSEEEVIGRQVAGFWKNSEEARRVLSTLVAEGQWSGRVEALKRDGGTFVAEVSAHLVRSPEGRPLCMMASFLDVTAKVRSEEALSHSEAVYRGLVENARAIVLTWEPEGKITYWNDFAAQFFGFSREEILGRSLFDTIVPRVETTGRNLESLLLNIGRDPDRFASNINQNITKDGRPVWVAWANRPIAGPDGSIQSVISYGTDITRLKEAEATLTSSEGRLKAIFDAVPECIKIIDSEGVLLDINPAGLAMLGTTAQQLMGKKAYRIVTPPFRKAFREFTRRVCRGERASMEFDILNFRGETLKMQSSAAPIQLTPGAPAACLAITRVLGRRYEPAEPVVPD